MNQTTPPVQKYQPKLPISVCLIAKNERRNIPRFQRSIEAILGHPEDEVVLVDTGSEDATIKEARKRGWTVIDGSHLCDLDAEALIKQYLPPNAGYSELLKHGHYKGGLLRSFSEARQLGYDAARNRIIFWMDLDDSIHKPETFRPAIDNVYEDGKSGAMLMAYQYAHASDGSCTTVLWRERVTTKGDFYWKGKCHETLIPDESKQNMALCRDPDWECQIVHATPKSHQFSDLRNYLILRNDLETNDYRDPRTLFYLGNACRGLNLFVEALRWYTEFVGCSGNKDDVLAAFLTMAGCFNELGRHFKAVQACEEAMRVAPEDSRVYYFMADAWFRLGHWPNVLQMVRLGDACPRRDTLHAIDPNTMGFHPAAIAAAAARQLRNPDMAMEFGNRAMQERPDWDQAQNAYEDMARWAGATKLGMLCGQVLQHCANPREAIKHMPMSPHLREYGLGVPEEDQGPVPEGKKTVVFYCGHSAEPWGPMSAKTGMGASEKMVVDLAKVLAKDPRYHVMVYATMPNGTEGTYDDVIWRHSATFNSDIYRDYLIIWRVPQVLKTKAHRAGKIFVWMHDCGHDAWWEPEVLEQVDKVFFLSRFQRGLHPSVPEEKVYYTRNGVDLDRHMYDGTPKQKKIVYLSSPDRGWLKTIELFKRSRLAEEGYVLHMFYGFGKHWRTYAAQQSFGHVVELEKETNLYQYEDACYDACDGVTVINRGRIGWEEIAKELKEAEIWLYPTVFDEISCVAAMEAMAAGCKCVCTNHAALGETMLGYPAWFNLSTVPKDQTSSMLRWAAGLGWRVKDDKVGQPLPPMVEGDPEAWAMYAKQFDITKLAVQWAADLFTEEEAHVEVAPAGFSLDVETGTVGGATEECGSTQEAVGQLLPGPEGAR